MKKTKTSKGIGRYCCYKCGYTSPYPLNNHGCFQQNDFRKVNKDLLRFGDNTHPSFEYT